MSFSYERAIPATKTVISDDGKRYREKVGGSPFGLVTASPGVSCRSCFFCGQRLPTSAQGLEKVGKRNEVVCRQVCSKNTLGLRRLRKLEQQLREQELLNVESVAGGVGSGGVGARAPDEVRGGHEA